MTGHPADTRARWASKVQSRAPPAARGRSDPFLFLKLYDHPPTSSPAPCVLLSDLQRFPAVRQRVSSRSRSLSSSSARLGSPVLFSSLPRPCASGAPGASRADRQSYLVKSSALACSVESPHQPVFELHHWKLASFEQSHRFPLKSGPHRPSVGRAGRFRCGQRNSLFDCLIGVLSHRCSLCVPLHLVCSPCVL